MNTLSVPIESQVLPGALNQSDDCGPTSEKMEGEAYSLLSESVDIIYQRVHTPGNIGVSGEALAADLNKTGLPGMWKTGLKLGDLYIALTEGKPILVMVMYKPFVDAGLTEFAGFLGLHFMVVTGVDIKSVAYNDPYRNDNKANVEAPITVFMAGWTQAGCGAFIPGLPIQNLSHPIPSLGKYITTCTVNVRNKAVEAGSVIVGTVPKGATVTVDLIDKANNRMHMIWISPTGNTITGWVWIDYLKAV